MCGFRKWGFLVCFMALRMAQSIGSRVYVQLHATVTGGICQAPLFQENNTFLHKLPDPLKIYIVSAQVALLTA